MRFIKENVAPVVIFVYNRLDYAERTVNYLKKNELAELTDLFIFSDAAKDHKQLKSVQDVRTFIHTIDGFKSVNIFEAEKNKGLAYSVITGVTEILNRYGKVITVEDDILTSKCFLKFMNDALEYYQNDSTIWSISGYQYPFEIPASYDKSVYLSPRSSSWGWGTWKDRWDTIDWSIKDYKSYRYNPFRIAHFCKGGTDLDKMLRAQMSGKIDSWAIRWCYNQSMQGKYTVYPVCSLVNNIGTDGSGTHCDPSSARFQQKICDDFSYEFTKDLSLNSKITKRYRKIVDRSIIRRVKRILATKLH